MEPCTCVRQVVWHENNCLGAAALSHWPLSGPLGAPLQLIFLWEGKSHSPGFGYDAGEVTAQLSGSCDIPRGTAGPKNHLGDVDKESSTSRSLNCLFHTQQGLGIADFWLSLASVKSDACSTVFLSWHRLGLKHNCLRRDELLQSLLDSAVPEANWAEESPLSLAGQSHPTSPHCAVGSELPPPELTKPPTIITGWKIKSVSNDSAAFHSLLTCLSSPVYFSCLQKTPTSVSRH